MSFRDQLVDSIVESLRPAVERAVNMALGFGTQPSTPGPVASAPTRSRAKRVAATAAARTRPSARRARRNADSYSAADPGARRLPNFVKTLLGKELPKAEILAKYGDFRFTPSTTPEELQAAADAVAQGNMEAPSGGSVEAEPKKEAARRLSVRAGGPIARRKAASK